MSRKNWKYRIAAGVLAAVLAGAAAVGASEPFEPDTSDIAAFIEEQTSAWQELEQTSEWSSVIDTQELTSALESMTEFQTQVETLFEEELAEPGTVFEDIASDLEGTASSETTTYDESLSENISSQQIVSAAREVIACDAEGYAVYSAPVYLKADAASAPVLTMPVGVRAAVRAVVTEGDEPSWYHVIFAVDDTGYEGYVRSDAVAVDNGGMSLYDLRTDVDQTHLFPADYQMLIYALKEKYPNWIFQPLYTGLDFTYAVEQEQSLVNRNLVHISQIMDWKSLKMLNEDENGEVYNYNWQTDTWYEWEPSIVAASDESVAYCMDPRNFINEKYIFMFEDLTFHGEYQTVETVEALLEGTFMYRTNVPGEEFTYAWLLHWIGEKYGINPVMLASRLRQEQGIHGTSELISGTYEGYESLYNHFNIMASGKTRHDIVTSGLTIARKGSSMMLPYALQDIEEEIDSTEEMSNHTYGEVEEAYIGPWDTPTKSIIGGALNIATAFILVGQDSLYLQKFDVDNSDGKLFWHQYMQNVQAPMSESTTVRKSYTNMNLLDQPFVFSIPVFGSMPESTPAPVSNLNPNNRLNSLKVNGRNVFTEFDMNAVEFTIEVGYSTEIAEIEVTPASLLAVAAAEESMMLAVGENIFNFTVTAENGAVRNYTLKIIRLEEGVEEPTVSPEETELAYGELLVDGTMIYIGLQNGKKGSVYIPYYGLNMTEDGQFILIDGVEQGTDAQTFLRNIDVKGNIWAGLFYGEDLTQKNGTDPVGTGVYLVISDHGTGKIVMCSPIIIYGDVDGDGVFSMFDFSMGKAQLLGRYTMTEEQEFASDLDGDGVFNIIDFSLMKGILLGRYELVQNRNE